MKRLAKDATVRGSTLDAACVQVGSGAKLVNVQMQARKIVVRSNATLEDCKLFAQNGSIIIGRGAMVKERAVLNAFCGIRIGDRTIIDRDVFAGGMQSEKSELVVGSDSVVLYRSYLNTTRKISIGSNTGIGGYTKIFTHSSWQNALEGNPYRFADVEIKDGAWLAWNIIVMPGIVIEKDATVGSGAVVTKSLPPSAVAVGVPAKIVRTKKPNITESEKHHLMLAILDDFSSYANGFLKLKCAVRDVDSGRAIEFKGQRVLYSRSGKPSSPKDIAISFKIPPAVKKKSEWIELDTLSASVKSDAAKQFIAFIKRYGIRIQLG